MWSRIASRIVVPCGLLLLVGITAQLHGFGLLAVARAQVGTKAKESPKAQPAASTARSEDRAGIRSTMDSFVKAFESGDAKALAALWTADGEYHNEQGTTVGGQAALEKGFAEFFAKTPEVKAEVHPESLRFLSAGLAVEEGRVAVRSGPAASAKNARYSATFVREDGRWRLALLSESALDEPSIEDLAWLIGQWKSLSGEEAEIRTTYSWDSNKKFIVARFSLKEDERSFSGNQVIGVDPATGDIRSWTFESASGIGEADWSRDGDQWVLDATATLADGSTLTQTNILWRVNDDTFTWQSIDRMIDELAIPDLPPVKVTRIKSEK